MPRSPTFSSPPNFWKTCTGCTFLTPQPSGSLTLCTTKTVLTTASSAWESHWKLFQVLFYMNSSHWPISLWCFLPLASGMSRSSGFWSFLLTFSEKAMAPHSSTLAWKSHGWRSLVGCSPWYREVGHDWATSLSLFTLMHWRRKWQPTPVFLPGESQRRGSLVGCCLWGCTELNMTEVT